jgi:hypothetical protein
MTRLMGAFVLIAAQAVAQWSTYPLRKIPRLPDGKPDLTAPAPVAQDGKTDLSGVWLVPFTGDPTDLAVRPRYVVNLAADLKPEQVSMQPWAAKLYQERSSQFGKEFPGARCLPIGIPLSIATPEPFKIVQTADLIVVLHETGNLFRQVYLDGRKPAEDPQPTWMGYSRGHWDKAELVVESSGFNDKTWLDARGHPHSEALRLIERYRRPNFGHLEIEITVDDPKTYIRPWAAKMGADLLTDTDIMEAVCNENERDSQHLVGR